MARKKKPATPPAQPQPKAAPAAANDTKPARAAPRFNSTYIRYPDKIVDEQSGHTALIAAVIKGDAEQAERLVLSGASLNKAGKDGRTPLHHAARLGRFDIVGLLLEAGAQVNPRDKNLETPLFAALSCHEPLLMIDLLLEAGAKPDIPDAEGRIPLHAAALSAPPPVIRLLIAATENPNRPDARGYQPLHRACESNSVEAVQAILFERVAIFSASMDGDTCLHLAAARQDSTAVADYLLTTEAAHLVNAVNLMGRSPLHIAVLHKHGKLVEGMIALGANVNVPDNQGNTPLHEAAEANDISMARRLIEAGADVAKAEGFRRTTPLILSIRAGGRELSELLLSHGADPSGADDGGQTPLMAAANKPNDEIVGLLLGAGADARPKDSLGRNVLQHCGPGLSEETMGKLIDAGADVNNRDAWQRTPVISAIMEHNTALVHALLQKGADPNAKDDQGYSPLQVALTYRKLELIDILLAKGADANITDRWTGQSALALACALGLDSEVGKLVEAGGDPNAKDAQGKTPLHVAVQNSYSSSEAVRLLLKKGADPLQKDNEGHSAYDLAYSLDKTGATQLIRQHLAAKGIEAKPERYNPYGYNYGGPYF